MKPYPTPIEKEIPGIIPVLEFYWNNKPRNLRTDLLEAISFFKKKQSRFNHIGRNNPCPCGSSKKYKKCCL